MNTPDSLCVETIPAQQVPSRALLIVLHGLGDSSQGWEWLPGELRLPWLEYALVTAPDPYYGGYSWYDLPGDAGPGVRRSRELLQHDGLQRLTAELHLPRLELLIRLPVRRSQQRRR